MGNWTGSRTAATLAASLALGLTACGGGGGSAAGSSSGGDSGGSGSGNSGGGTAAEYRILASNDLGMHCVDADFSVFSILPPYNVVNAQVVRRSSTGAPVLVDDTTVVLRYSAIADGAGSINTRSGDKTNFWLYVGRLYGADLPLGQGLKGLRMPAEATTAEQTQFGWKPAESLFKAEGVPIFPLDDAGNRNRYPLMRLTATDRSSGRSLATLDVVLPVSEETTCSDCHATGAPAARPGSVAWSNDPDLEIQSRENVLRLHDARTGTTLVASKPVLCAGCHYSPALDLAGTGPSATQAGHATMSAAMHAFHAGKMIDASGRAYADEWIAQGQTPTDPTRQACYLCHPGRGTRCLRGAMTDTVTCQNCHGGMTAVGGTTALRTGGSIDGTNDGHPRRPWADLPRCQSCHTGDANSRLTLADPSQMAPDGIRALLAFTSTDASASPRLAANKRFAENDGRLFRYSKGHGGVACEGCHNSTHAIWPNPVAAANDNVAANQLQGHAGTIVECSVCHAQGTAPLGLGGPHGMHVVGDSRWRQESGHPRYAKSDRTACAACHGTDFRGTALSRTAAQRSWGTRTVPAGMQVGCYDCHNGPNGGD